MRLLLVALALSLLPGCDVDGCEAFLYVGPTVVVTVQDADTGAYLTEATVTVEDGDVSATLALAEYAGLPPQFEGVPTRERRFDEVGIYLVTATADGYDPAVESLALTAEVCSGQRYPAGPATFAFALVPSSPE